MTYLGIGITVLIGCFIGNLISGHIFDISFPETLRLTFYQLVAIVLVLFSVQRAE